MVGYLFLFLTVVATMRRPLAGAAIAMQSYVLRYAFVPPGYSGALQSEGVLGVLFPLAVYLIMLWKTRLRLNQFRFSFADVAVSLMGLTVLAGVFYSVDSYRGLEIAARLWGLALAYYLVVRWYLKSIDASRALNEVRGFLVTTWLLSVLVAVLAVVAPGGSVARLSVGAVHPIPFAMLVGSGLLIGLMWLVAPKESCIRPWILCLALPVQAYVFLASNSRGPALAMGASFVYAVFVFCVRTAKVWFIGRSAFVVAISLIVGGGVFSLHPLVGERLWAGIVDALAGQEGEKGLSVLERLWAWERAKEMFLRRPLTGMGTGSFGAMYGLDYPHNLVLEIAAENGLIGLAVLFGLVIAVYKAVVGAARRYVPETLVLVASLLLATVLEAQVSFTLWMQKGLFIYLAMGQLIGSVGLPPSTRTSPKGSAGKRSALAPLHGRRGSNEDFDIS